MSGHGTSGFANDGTSGFASDHGNPSFANEPDTPQGSRSTSSLVPHLREPQWAWHTACEGNYVQRSDGSMCAGNGDYDGNTSPRLREPQWWHTGSAGGYVSHIDQSCHSSAGNGANEHGSQGIANEWLLNANEHGTLGFSATERLWNANDRGNPGFSANECALEEGGIDALTVNDGFHCVVQRPSLPSDNSRR